MTTDVKRIGKGTISHKNEYLDTEPVPENHIRIVKAITLCNRHPSIMAPVTISFAGTDVIHKYNLEYVLDENTLTIPYIDQVLEAGERITGHVPYFNEDTGIVTGSTDTTLTDSAKTWTPFEWVPEHYIKVTDTQYATVSSNTDTTITITTPWSIIPSIQNYFEAYVPGTASGTTATTLSDDTKVWNLNMWAGFYIRNIPVEGVKEQVRQIVSNTANILTIDTAWDVTPSATTEYEIFKSGYVSASDGSTISDNTKSWGINTLTNFTIRINEEQIREITAHSDNTLTISEPWNLNPSEEAVYDIFKNWVTYMISGREISLLEE